VKSNHQNINGPCEHHLHPQALLGEHQPCCHPPRDLLAVGPLRTAAPRRLVGSGVLPLGLPCGAQLSTSKLPSRKGQRGNFSKFQAQPAPGAGSGLAAFTSLGNTGQALQMFQFPLQRSAQGSLPQGSHCSPHPGPVQGLGLPPAHVSQGPAGAPLAEGTQSI